jgi:aconitate hydratase
MMAKYIMSPLLVVAYALAGTVAIDFDAEPLGENPNGFPVYLRDIWPTRTEILDVECQFVLPQIFSQVNSRLKTCEGKWDKLDVVECPQFVWDLRSTYIQPSPFFDNLMPVLPSQQNIIDAHVLLHVGDSLSTDYISLAGSIARNSSAANYLASQGVSPRDVNSYGSRRGNYAVMVRGMFAHTRLVNKLIKRPGPQTLHVPSSTVVDVYEAAMKYQASSIPVIILAGKDYGTGSPKDWVAKGQSLLGVKAVIAESFDETHRCALVGVGILPLQFNVDQTSKSLHLTGTEKYSIELPDDLSIGQQVTVKLNNGRCVSVTVRLDSNIELSYYRHGGLLQYTACQYLLRQH